MHILSGNFAGRYDRFELKQGRNTLGRGSRNEIDLDNNAVSREHAEFMVEGDRILLRDLKSSNGTFINGERLKEGEQRELHHKDVVSFGAQQLTLLAEGMPEVLPEDLPASARDTVEQTPAAILHNTILSLSENTMINEQETMSWDEATGDLGPTPEGDGTLYRVLNEIGNQMVLPQPLQDTLDHLVSLVERVINARRILIVMSEDPDEPPVVRAARPATASGEKTVLSRTIIAKVLEDRETLCLNDTQSDPDFRAQQSIILQNIRSAMVAPLFDNREVIGFLYADSDDRGVRYDRNQMRAFTLMANLIAVKITNARLLEVKQEKDRLKREAEEAAKVQKKLLPAKLPVLSGFEIAARQIPCYEVAGDLYDVRELKDGRIAIVVGDVTGKGMGAAMLMSLVMSGLDILFEDCQPPLLMAERLHRQLLKRSDDMHFVTLFLGLLDPKTSEMEYVNAGHNPPILMLSDDEPLLLETTGMPLGLMPGAEYKVKTIMLPDDFLFCAFSDGIPEAMVEDEFYGEDRFLESARNRCHQPLEEIIDGAFEDLQKFVCNASLEDDATLLLLRRCGK